MFAIKDARKDGIPEFVGSAACAGWCTRFMRRNDLVLRRNTK